MKDNNTIKVSKIDIQIGKQVISLTPDELKELKKVLDETFPTEKIHWIPSQPIYIPQPIYVPHNPSWTSPTIGDPAPPYWTITCQTETSTVLLNLNNNE